MDELEDDMADISNEQVNAKFLLHNAIGLISNLVAVWVNRKC